MINSSSISKHDTRLFRKRVNELEVNTAFVYVADNQCGEMLSMSQESTGMKKSQMSTCGSLKKVVKMAKWVIYIMFLVSVHCFYDKSRDFMLE